MFDILLKIVQMKMITNIAAGIILFFVLKMFIEWTSEILHIQRVKRANKKVMELLRPYASSTSFPSRETLASTITSIGMDCNVRYEDLNPVTYYLQIFIKEIMEDAYIPLDKKEEYTKNLRNQIKQQEEAASVQREGHSSQILQSGSSFKNYNSRNLCIFLSSFFVAVTGKLSNVYDLYEAMGIFVVVTFSLMIFSDFVLMKKWYRQIPRLMSIVDDKIKEVWEEGKTNWEAKKKEKEENEFQRGKRELETERESLLEDKKKMIEEHKQLTEQKQQLEEERRKITDMIPEADTIEVKSDLKEFSAERAPEQKEAEKAV